MKAVVYHKYGDPEVLQLEEIERPTPRDNEVLIRVFATTVTLYDCWVRSSTAPTGFGLLSRISSGIRKPKQPILRTELAGEVIDVGKGVTLFEQMAEAHAYVESGQKMGQVVITVVER